MGIKMDKDTKEKLTKRFAKAEGHLKKVRKMLEENEYCLDIIHQSRAVQAALRKVDQIILHSHLHTCVLKDIHGKNTKNEKFIQEIVKLFEKI
jgi:DNA-binding FrmR family transcriptional regulator